MRRREAPPQERARDSLLFAGIAITFFVAAWLIGGALGPFSADPDYQYLMNGLGLLGLQVPNHFDHPGTPVQIIIAIILAASWLLTLPWHGLSSVQDVVLAHPQFYLQCINCVFAVGIAGALIFFAWSVRKASGFVTPAVIGLISIFLSNSVYMTFHRIMPEPVLLIGSLTLAGLLAQNIFATDAQRPSPYNAAAVGILLGLCLTAKVTSAPLLVAILLLPGRRAKKTAVTALLVSVAVFLIPIYPRLHIMVRGYLHILSHKGDYGSGSAGAPSFGELLQNLGLLWQMVPEMFLFPALYGAVLTVRQVMGRSLPRDLSRALLLCISMTALALLIVAKQPRALYLLPFAAFLCLGNTILAFLLLRSAKFSGWLQLAIIALLTVAAARIQYRYARIDHIATESDTILMEHVARSGCLTVLYYGVNQPAFNLFLGNVSSGQKNSARLKRLYPNFVAYVTDARQFRTFDQTLSREAVAQRFSREKCVNFMGVAWRSEFGIPAESLIPLAHSTGRVYLYSLASQKIP